MIARAGAILLLSVASVAGHAADAAPAIRRPPGERTIDSWGIVCVRAPQRRCLATQIVAADPRGTKVLLGITLTPDAQAPTLHLRVGPAIDRAAGFGIRLENGTELRLPVDRCTDSFCETAGRLLPPIRARFGRVNMAQVAWRVAGKRQIVVPINLRGFEAALAAISGGPPPARTGGGRA